ncbi:hypothetical protein QCE73_15085 [Caballeronia sp. LZ029]|uniref:hypothetical protein n=1 Tax=Caballeronia sp. LZ029 TaxID=3038564 RepID=UPI002859448B|nr:hypothetical protein [Caballeronia sp. LZ029]MDR5744479.1 hypothetical protein [Caballeronia sp. LZ029]
MALTRFSGNGIAHGLKLMRRVFSRKQTVVQTKALRRLFSLISVIESIGIFIDEPSALEYAEADDMMC